MTSATLLSATLLTSEQDTQRDPRMEKTAKKL
jgi:hypothetical protein